MVKRDRSKICTSKNTYARKREEKHYYVAIVCYRAGFSLHTHLDLATVPSPLLWVGKMRRWRLEGGLRPEHRPRSRGEEGPRFPGCHGGMVEFVDPLHPLLLQGELWRAEMDLRRGSSMATAASYLQWWVEGRTRRLGPTPWVMLPAPEPRESGGPGALRHRVPPWLEARAPGPLAPVCGELGRGVASAWGRG